MGKLQNLAVLALTKLSLGRQLKVLKNNDECILEVAEALRGDPGLEDMRGDIEALISTLGTCLLRISQLQRTCRENDVQTMTALVGPMQDVHARLDGLWAGVYRELEARGYTEATI